MALPLAIQEEHEDTFHAPAIPCKAGRKLTLRVEEEGLSAEPSSPAYRPVAALASLCLSLLLLEGGSACGRCQGLIPLSPATQHHVFPMPYFLSRVFTEACKGCFWYFLLSLATCSLCKGTARRAILCQQDCFSASITEKRPQWWVRLSSKTISFRDCTVVIIISSICTSLFDGRKLALNFDGAILKHDVRLLCLCCLSVAPMIEHGHCASNVESA